MPTETQVRDHPIQTAEDLQSTLVETGIPVDMGDLEHPPPREVVKKRERKRAVETWNKLVGVYQKKGPSAVHSRREAQEGWTEDLSEQVNALERRLHEKRIARDLSRERVQAGQGDDPIGDEISDLPGPTPPAYARSETWGEVLKDAREDCQRYEEKLDKLRGLLQNARFKRDLLKRLEEELQQDRSPERLSVEPNEDGGHSDEDDTREWGNALARYKMTVFHVLEDNEPGTFSSNSELYEAVDDACGHKEGACRRYLWENMEDEPDTPEGWRAYHGMD